MASISTRQWLPIACGFNWHTTSPWQGQALLKRRFCLDAASLISLQVDEDIQLKKMTFLEPHLPDREPSNQHRGSSCPEQLQMPCSQLGAYCTTFHRQGTDGRGLLAGTCVIAYLLLIVSNYFSQLTSYGQIQTNLKLHNTLII